MQRNIASSAPEAPENERRARSREGENPDKLPMPNSNGLERAMDNLKVNGNPEFLDIVARAPLSMAIPKPRRQWLKKAKSYLLAIGIVIKLFFLTKVLRRKLPVAHK